MNIYELANIDFRSGTYRISNPGIYILKEDIIFDPNSDNDGKPWDWDLTYKTKAYTFGFFAAITIETNNVEIDLNNHSIKQSTRHSYFQRFFSIIELASTPFLPKQGPANFGNEIISANNITIKNGSFLLSAHHGIHGNDNSNITIQNIDFFNMEVAAIHINNPKNIKVKNCNIYGTSQNVKSLGFFSHCLHL